MYKNFLELEGYEVVGSACTGDKALTEYKQLRSKPDVVIMDHLIPNEKGRDAVLDILTYDADAKIIFVSIDQNFKKEMMDIGVKRFICKPFEMQSLIDNIREIADR